MLRTPIKTSAAAKMVMSKAVGLEFCMKLGLDFDHGIMTLLLMIIASLPNANDERLPIGSLTF